MCEVDAGQLYSDMCSSNQQISNSSSYDEEVLFRAYLLFIQYVRAFNLVSFQSVFLQSQMGVTEFIRDNPASSLLAIRLILCNLSMSLSIHKMLGSRGFAML